MVGVGEKWGETGRHPKPSCRELGPRTGLAGSGQGWATAWESSALLRTQEAYLLRASVSGTSRSGANSSARADGGLPMCRGLHWIMPTKANGRGQWKNFLGSGDTMAL